MTQQVLGFILGVVGSLLASFIYQFIRDRKAKKLEQSAQLTGTWEQTLIDDQGQVKKKDLLIIKQNGKEVTAHSKREFPVNEGTKSWQFRGRFEGDLLVGYFFGVTDSKSRGTAQLYEVNQRKMQGFYYKTSSANEVDGNSTKIGLKKSYDKVDVVWNKL